MTDAYRAMPAGDNQADIQAAFIGVGAMVGAGIFALLGAAGEVAGAAVWISFLIAGGTIAGAPGVFVREVRRPVPVGGRTARVRRAGGSATATSRRDHRVAGPRGQRHRHRHGRRLLRQLTPARRSPIGNEAWVKVFAIARGPRHDDRSTSSGRRRWPRSRPSSSSSSSASSRCSPSPTLANLDLDLLAFSGYPGIADIVVQRGLDLLRLPRLRGRHVHRQGPRPTRHGSSHGRIYLALGIATVIYVAVALGVFGTLTVAGGHSPPEGRRSPSPPSRCSVGPATG